jgi:hypothetical protein
MLQRSIHHAEVCMPRSIRPWGQWRPGRPLAAVLLVVLLALLSVAQLASAAPLPPRGGAACTPLPDLTPICSGIPHRSVHQMN